MFSTLPASDSPGRNLTDSNDNRGVCVVSPRSRFRKVIAGHCGGVTSRMPIEASNPWLFLKLLSNRSKGAVDEPNPSTTAAVVLTAIGVMKKQSPPSYCWMKRRTTSARTGFSGGTLGVVAGASIAELGGAGPDGEGLSANGPGLN